MQELAKWFVVVADDVNVLQTGSGPEARFFQAVARHGPGRGRTGVTQQGTYCFTPAGEVLAAHNTRDPDLVVRLLRQALARWERLPRQRRLGADEPPRDAARAENHYPHGGLVLRQYTRDLGPKRALGDYANPWNTDTVWFRAAEARRLVPAAARKGTAQAVPAGLVRRLARLHLLDTVLGQGVPFPDRAVEEATLTATVTAVAGDRVTLRYTGRTRAAAGGRSLETTLRGRAVWDRGKEAFTSFELLAEGNRRGRFPAPYIRGETGAGRIGFAFVLAGDGPGDRSAPAYFAAYGWR